MQDLIIQAKKLSKIYHLLGENIAAVKDVDLDIHAGDFISLMGPSGSGKTTLLDSIGCLTTISGGELIVSGKDVSTASESALVRVRRGALSFVFQDFHLFNTLTTKENVAVPLILQNKTMYLAGFQFSDKVARFRKLLVRHFKKIEENSFTSYGAGFCAC